MDQEPKPTSPLYRELENRLLDAQRKRRNMHKELVSVQKSIAMYNETIDELQLIISTLDAARLPQG